MQKTLFTLMIILASVSCSDAQNTWYRYFQAEGYSSNLDQNCKILEIEQEPLSGRVWVINESSNRVFISNVDSSGNNAFSMPLVQYSSIQQETLSDLVLINNQAIAFFKYNGLNSTISWITRIDSIGNTIWRDSMITSTGQPSLTSICLNSTGDSLYAFDGNNRYSYDPLTGALVTTTPFGVFGIDFLSLSSGDFIYKSVNGNSILNVDFTGTVNWSYQGKGFGYDTSYFAVLDNGNTATMYDINNNLIWSVATSPTVSEVSDMAITSGGGLAFVTVNSLPIINHFFYRYTNTGQIAALKSYKAGLFGFSKILQALNGGFITGGGYVIAVHDTWYQSTLPDVNNGYGSFIAQADSMGNGPDLISNFWSADVNFDGFYDISDGLFLGIAMGATGISRNSIGVPLLTFSNHGEMRPSVDWNQSFLTGGNYKNADANGDGVVDAADAYYLTTWGSSHPFWKNSQPACCLSIVASDDTVYSGQQFSFYIIAGSPSTPIDTAYGFHMNITTNNANPGAALDLNSSSFDIYPGTFGDSSNAMTFRNDHPGSQLFQGPAEYYVTKLNQLNAVGLYDTIAEFNLTAANVNSIKYFDLTINDASLIQIDESINTVTAGLNQALVVIMPGTTGLNEIFNSGIVISPNPGDDNFVIHSTAKIEMAELFDISGKCIPVQLNNNTVNTAEIPSGFYTLQMKTTDGNLVRKPVVISH